MKKKYYKSTNQFVMANGNASKSNLFLLTFPLCYLYARFFPFTAQCVSANNHTTTECFYFYPIKLPINHTTTTIIYKFILQGVPKYFFFFLDI